jgi:hypothetical protein
VAEADSIFLAHFGPGRLEPEAVAAIAGRAGPPASASPARAVSGPGGRSQALGSSKPHPGVRKVFGGAPHDLVSQGERPCWQEDVLTIQHRYTVMFERWVGFRSPIPLGRRSTKGKVGKTETWWVCSNCGMGMPGDAVAIEGMVAKGLDINALKGKGWIDF